MLSLIAKGAVTAARNRVLKPYFKLGVSTGNLNTTTLAEPSGMVCASRPENDGYLFATSDSGGPTSIVTINRSTAAVSGSWTLTGATNTDWESMTGFRRGDVSYIVIGDTGNNGNALNTRGTGIDVRFYRFQEPTVTGSDGTIGTIESIDCVYPAGNTPTHRDCEAIFADPDSGDIYLVNKRVTPIPVYRLPYAASYTGIQTLVYMGTLTTDSTLNTISTCISGNNGYVTDACISPNGNEILIRNYNSIYHWRRNKSSESIIQCLGRTYDSRLNHIYVGGGGAANNVTTGNSKFFHPDGEPQGECITFDRKGIDFYTCSEFVSDQADTSGARRVNPLFRYERIGIPYTAVSFQNGTAPTGAYAGCVDTYIDSQTTASENTTNFSTATSLVMDYDFTTFPTISRWRHALIKWDISQIPTDATVTGAYIDFYISNEGKQFALYQMLQTWDATTITYSNSGGIALDGVEASSTPAAVFGTTQGTGIALDNFTGFIRVNLPLSLVQSWVSTPASNFGLLGTGGPNETSGDGLQVESCESATANRKPRLTVLYTGGTAIGGTAKFDSTTIKFDSTTVTFDNN